MTNVDSNAPLDGVAIIGMAGRFPGARNIAEFWRNLTAGVESIARFECKDLERSSLDDSAVIDHPEYVPARGILDDVELFDAEFFGVNPREAQVLDPQQRLFLEAAWEALEHAGYDPGATKGVVGVFAGMSNNSYFPANLQGHRGVVDLVGPLQTMMGNEKDYLATRVSYKLDLKGPSVSIQTACSSSLVAVCQAAQSLLGYQCDMALAGGVSITLPQKRGYLPYDGSITSSDGHCRAFDARAQGTVFSNGLGVVVLKRLADALADGDHISAVIKGTAVNNDGSAKVSFLAPSVGGHADAVIMAQAFARVNPRTVSYVEAHGTGTALGDVVEVAALTNAFRTETADARFCALGSVKTNIGHLDAAAGVAGLIKAVLALQHRLIPSTLHFTTPNPKLSLDETPFFVNTVPLEWPAGSTPRRAGVSSLGAGGTNAHVVLEERPEVEPSCAGRGTELLVVSARTPSALDHATENIVDFLERNLETPFADVAYTLQVGRRHFAHRRALVCRNREDAVRELGDRQGRRVLAGLEGSGDTPVAFVFPDKVRVPPGCGRELYDRETVFRAAFDDCVRAFRLAADVDIAALLYSTDPVDEAGRATTRSERAALFVVEYALARLWLHWGVRPTIVIGRGVGELVAGVISGELSLDEAATRAIRQPSGDGADPITPLSLPAHALALVIGPPGGQLSTPNIAATVLPTLRDHGRDIESVFETLAHLWLHGVEVDWRALHDGERRARVPLPTYPFERERYWIDPAPRVPDARPSTPADETSPPPTGGSVLSRLVTLFSELSGLAESRLPVSVNFYEFGLDSLFLTQATSAIRNAFGVTITFRELLEELDTIESLATRIAERMPTGAPAQGIQASGAASPIPRDGPAVAAAKAAPSASVSLGPYRPIEKGSASGLSDQQRHQLEAFIGRYTARTGASKRSTAIHRGRLADPRTVAGFRSVWKELVYPLVVVRSAGSRLWDVDGNEYVDLVNGFGTNLFGHSPVFVVEALERQLKRGFEIGPQSAQAGPVAAQIAEMTGHERVAFCNTGSEAVTAAIRMARTVTGRDKIAMFAGAYHGTFDEALVRGTTIRGELRSVPIAPGIPGSACENAIVLEYGSPAALEVLRAHGSELAALLVEPVQSRRPDLQPIEFLRKARQITQQTGTALVFDEVVTGFRVHPAGAQALFGIKPDLATYGKVLGGGLPIGVVAGDSNYLDALDGGRWEYGDESFPEVGMTFFAGTFVRHPLALAAAHAVLDHLKAQGPELQRRLNLRTTSLVDRLEARAAESNAPIAIPHFSSWFCFNIPSHLPLGPLFFAFMRSKGIHVWEGRPAFVSSAHTEEDLERIVDAFGETIAEMQESGFLPAAVSDTPPVPGARRGRHPDGRGGWFVSDPDRPGRYLEVSTA